VGHLLARSALATLLCSSISFCACSNTSENRAYLRAPGPEDAQRLLVVVSNEGSNDISLIDGATDALLSTLPVGKRPRGLKVSPDGSKLYVALSGNPRGGPNVDESTLPPPDRSADGIGVVEVARLLLPAPPGGAAPASEGIVQQGSALQPAQAGTEPPSILHGKLVSGDDPETIDATPDGRILAVANEDSARLRLMDAENGALLASIGVGVEPEGLRFRPDGKVVYVTSEANDQLDVIDVAERRVIATVPVGKRPRSILFSPDGARAYISCELAARVDVIDAQAHRPIATVEIDGPPQTLPMGLALDPSEQRLYVTLGRAGEVAVIDVRAMRVLTRISGVGARPWGVALSPDADKLYTANGPSGDVSVIDTRSLQVVRRIPVGKLPWGISLVRVK
jgi:YVTN family beta-propeller protein